MRPWSPLLLKADLETQRHLFPGTFQVRAEVSSTTSCPPTEQSPKVLLRGRCLLLRWNLLATQRDKSWLVIGPCTNGKHVRTTVYTTLKYLKKLSQGTSTQLQKMSFLGINGTEMGKVSIHVACHYQNQWVETRIESLWALYSDAGDLRK